MKKIYLLVLVTLAIAGCQKDSAISSDKLYLSVEGMRGGEKLAVEGAASYWATGDRVRINDDVLEVTISEGAGTAVVTKSGAGFTSPYRGVYPSSIYSGNSSNTSYTLNLPANYTYATTTHYGRTLQNLQAPMVAYTDEGTNLKFKHVTGAVAVQVVNYYGFTIEVDNIVVTSTVSEGNAYNLCGMTAVTLSNGAPVVAASRDGVESTKSVTMNFNGADHLRIFAGDSAVVQIPVLPVGDGNKFKVQVTVHKVDQPAVSKTFENTQNTGGAMPRAKMGYARFVTGGLFTVSGTGNNAKKVIISQGNLQYNKVAQKWSFLTLQYDMVENSSQNVGSDYSSQDYITLFGWGTSGWDNGNYKFYPYNTTSLYGSQYGDSYGYGPTSGGIYTFDLTGDFSLSDWGVHNAITNGGNVAGRWRTLTYGQWDTLLTKRVTDSSVNGVSSARYTHASVNGKHGIIIFPDNFSAPALHTGSTWGTGTINGTSSWGTVIILSDWLLLEANGAVFLPASGTRTSSTVSSVDGTGSYWSSSCYNAQAPYRLMFQSKKLETKNNTMNKNGGSAVRLVRDMK